MLVLQRSETPDCRNPTPLMLALIWASHGNHIEVVKLLLEHFADEFIIDNDGKSFYDYLNKENKKVIKELYPNEVENALIASGN